MQVKEKDIDTGKIKGYGICKKKRARNLILVGPTTPTYSNVCSSSFRCLPIVMPIILREKIEDMLIIKFNRKLYKLFPNVYKAYHIYSFFLILGASCFLCLVCKVVLPFVVFFLQL